MLQLTSSPASVAAARLLIAERIRGEFREMPGLTLTVAQAQRLWNVDLSTCTEVLSQLVETGFLSRKVDGAYSRTSDLTAHPLRMAKAGIQYVEIDVPKRTGGVS
jgi:DNA-binding IclR family transcriptional regulator